MAVHYTRLNLDQANEAMNKIMAYSKEFDTEVSFGIYIAGKIINDRGMIKVDSVYDTAIDFISLMAKLVSVGATNISYTNLLSRVTYKHQGKVSFKIYHTQLWGGDVLKGLEPILTHQYVTLKATPNNIATINMREKSQILKDCEPNAGATIANTLFGDYYIRRMCAPRSSSTETNCRSCDSAPMQPRKPTIAFRADVDSLNEEIITDEGIERETEVKVPNDPASAPTTPVLENITGHMEQESKFFASMGSFYAQQWKTLDGLIRNKSSQKDREPNESINRPSTLKLMDLLRFAPDPICALTMPEIERLLAEPRRALRVERSNSPDPISTLTMPEIERLLAEARRSESSARMEQRREGQIALGYKRDGYAWTYQQRFTPMGPTSGLLASLTSIVPTSGYLASFPRYY